MFFMSDRPEAIRPREGALYKVIELHGCQFSLHYGYYEEQERENPASELMPIYPDFLRHPRYTADGYPFVTKMQDPCAYYKGKASDDRDCGECQYYLQGDELLGICVCPKNKQNEPENTG